MTNLRKRLDNVLTELAIIREGLNEFSNYPPCCLTVIEDGRVSCSVMGPFPEEEFLRKCKECRIRIKRILEDIALKQDEN